MEIVIPPRDGRPTYKYEWDENGEVVSTQRVSQATPENGGRKGRGRQTVQWPFQSVVTDASASTPTMAAFPFRRATWQPRGLLRDDASVSTRVDSTLIPDYVINYIRGETPETVARRNRNGGKIAERGVDVEHARRHQHQASRAAELEGFYEGNSVPSRTTSQCATDRGILPMSEKPNRGVRRLARGWRGGVALNALLAFVILVVSFVCLILAVSKSSMFAGETVIFSGSCATASNINWGLHALISVETVILVAGANYVFQVLSSPTRAELAAAHARKRWMDIGIPSIRNFLYISNGRVFLSLTILVAAVVTQVIYNSVIFTTQVGLNYRLVFVTQSFLTGAPFSNATSNNSGGLSRIDILELQDLAGRNELVNMTAAQCAQQFSGAFDTTFKAALVVTDKDSATSSLLQTDTPKGAAAMAQYGIVSSNKLSPLFENSAIQFCLAQPNSAAEETCNVSLSGSLLGIAALLNLLTVICTAAVLSKSSFAPLATLGDAVASFLKEPDPTTRGSCLMDKTDVRQGRWGFGEAKYWVPRHHYWLASPSLGRWASVGLPWLALAGLAAAALGITTQSTPAGVLSAFGSVSPHAVYLLPASAPASAAAIIASLPQLLLAALYLATNALMSTYFLSHESSLLALGQGNANVLRVSADPEGRQTTGLYLTLPRPWSWALAALFAACGFVLSQSVLVVAVRLADPSAPLPRDTSNAPSFVALGFSGVALLTLLALLVALAALVLGLGARRAPPAVAANGEARGNPLVLRGGSCSAVISARCHPLPADAVDAWRHPLAWGVVRHDPDLNVGHCAYTARRVAQLDLSRAYA